MLDFIAKLTVKRVFHNKFLITYILSSRIFVAPPRYTLLCSKSKFTHFPEATAVKIFLKSTISVPCNPSRMISTWCHCSSCKVKSVDITVAPCPRLNLHFKKHRRPILTIKLHPLVVDENKLVITSQKMPVMRLEFQKGGAPTQLYACFFPYLNSTYPPIIAIEIKSSSLEDSEYMMRPDACSGRMSKIAANSSFRAIINSRDISM